MRFRATACLPLLLIPALAPAQQVPVVQLGKPDAELAQSFDRITAIRELRDGRLIVADLYARTVSLVDLEAGTATAIGREGEGPNEFAFPDALLPLPGDTTWLVDPAQSRFLVIRPDGTPAGTVAFPDALLAGARFKGADAMGRIYAQTSPFGGSEPEPDLSHMPDSAKVLRWDRAGKSVADMGMVKLPAVAVSTSGGAGNRAVAIGQQPFPVADDWAVTSAGRVGFVRSGNYHVEWSAPAPRTGSTVVYTPLAVTGVDKQEREERRKDTRGALRITREVGGRSSGGPPPSQPKMPPVDWPETKPPFVAGSALASPSGELWVERSQPAKAPELVDVFDPAGKLTRQVRLPARSRLVAVGMRGIYVARTDDDGLWYLQRFKNP